MIHVAVGVDHCHDRLARPVLIIQVKSGLRGFLADQRIDQDKSGVAFDNRHVRQIEAAYLIDAIDNDEQPVEHIELSHAVQAGIDGVGRRLSLEKFVCRQVPG